MGWRSAFAILAFISGVRALSNDISADFAHAGITALFPNDPGYAAASKSCMYFRSMGRDV